MNKIVSISGAIFVLVVATLCFFIKFPSYLTYSKNKGNIISAAGVADDIKPPAERKKELTQKIDEYLQSQKFNGTALVIQNGDTILDKGYGYADFTKKIQNTAQTKYYIGSITKTVVAVSILQLQEQKKLDIYDNVHKYLPSFPEDKNISLFELLTHTSGIKGDNSSEKSFKPSSISDLVKWIGEQNLAFPPSTDWLYSDKNYIILASIVEKLSGESLKQYVTKHIFTPAGMTNSGILTNEKDVLNISKGYVRTEKGLVSMGAPLDLWAYGCGNMYSTTHDMYKLNKAIITRKLLSPQSIALMFTPVKHTYGMGYYIIPERYYNAGVISGMLSLNTFNWNKKMFVILLSNTRHDNTKIDYDLGHKIINIVNPPEQKNGGRT
ncbi:serine hydrolase domain-containing protein [Bacillus sp. OTU530]|uniref:serine hydrolase domain-containing protein n=1 Tax=Bacillus sp. OTU530 TaxID=3043862 RepID=UPI00313CD6E5